MVRPLITFIIEITLTIYVFKKGRVLPKTFAMVLFFLALYQLGEVVIFLTNGGYEGIQIAYGATTMLPPLGILLLQQVNNKRYGYLIFQALSLIFVGYFLTNPTIVGSLKLGRYCIKVENSNSEIKSLWGYYYQITLLITMIINAISYFKAENPLKRKLLKQIFIAYSSFALVANVLVNIIPELQASIASLMCALALIAAVIFSRISLNKEFVMILEDINLYSDFIPNKLSSLKDKIKLG